MEQGPQETTVRRPNRPRMLNIGQAVFEAALICLGVAVALVGQSWWESRTEERLELEYLSSLGAELQEAEREIVDLIALRERFQESAVNLLTLMRGPRHDSWPDSLVSSVTNLGYIPQYRPPRATLNDLVGSGNLSSVEDLEIRLQIARYLEAMEYNRGVEDFVTRHYERVIEPFFLTPEWAFLDGGPREREAPTLPRSRWPVDAERLAASRVLENTVASYLWTQRDAIDANKRLLRRVRELSALISGVTES